MPDEKEPSRIFHTTTCGYCEHKITPRWRCELIEVDDKRHTYLIWGPCPNCEKLSIEIDHSIINHPFDEKFNIHDVARLYPIPAPKNLTAPKEIPDHISRDYNEARAVQTISPRASAALARRCLETMLEEQDYTEGVLSSKIDALLNETNTDKMLPRNLRLTIDAIRNVGVFAAHPKKDIAGKIFDVEVDESEWCLEILELCFDHFYVQPKRDAERIQKLNAKLIAVGKPQMKPRKT